MHVGALVADVALTPGNDPNLEGDAAVSIAPCVGRNCFRLELAGQPRSERQVEGECPGEGDGRSAVCRGRNEKI